MASGQAVYDSAYLALAVRLDTQMITADQRFALALGALPLLAEHVCAVDAFPL
jgi:predicted nucleic acid-binding protein